MSEQWLWIDGAFVGADEQGEAAADDVVAPFETMGASAAVLPLWDRHLARLCATLDALGGALDPRGLRETAGELLRRNGHEDGVLRLVQELRPRGQCTWMDTRPRSGTSAVWLLPTVTRRATDAPPPRWKVRPRRFYDEVLAEARAGGADDGIVLAEDGALLETAVGNLWLLLDGQWVTPPDDGRMLPGIARGILLADSTEPRAIERRCDLADLHRAEALMVSNAVYGPRPAALLGQTVENRDSALLSVWQNAISG